MSYGHRRESGNTVTTAPATAIDTAINAAWHARIVAWLASPWVRRFLFAALVLAYAGAITHLWVRGIADLFDFNAYYVSSYGFVHGEDVYDMGNEYSTTNLPRWEKLGKEAGVDPFTRPYLYPPLTAQLIAFLLPFQNFMAGMIWIILTAVAFVIAAWWLGKLWTQPEGASIVYLLMLGFAPTFITIRQGQVNGFLLLALVVGLVGLTRRNHVVAGIGLAFAVHLKFIPLVLCLYLLWRKQWRAAIVAAVAVVAILLTVVPMFGLETLESYAKNFSPIVQFGRFFTKSANQGISGFWARMLLPFFEPDTVYRVYLGSVIVVVATTIAVCWPMRRLPAFWRYEYAFIICALLIIPPYTWFHMLALMMIPLVVVVEYLWRNQRWQLLGLVMALYLVADIHSVFYRHITINPWLASFPFALLMLLWGFLGWLIVQERRLVAVNAGVNAGAPTLGSGGRNALSVGQ